MSHVALRVTGRLSHQGFCFSIVININSLYAFFKVAPKSNLFYCFGIENIESQVNFSGKGIPDDKTKISHCHFHPTRFGGKTPAPIPPGWILKEPLNRIKLQARLVDY